MTTSANIPTSGRHGSPSLSPGRTPASGPAVPGPPPGLGETSQQPRPEWRIHHGFRRRNPGNRGTHTRTTVAGNLDDEAKTKQYLVVPFLRVLGYDDSVPSQVVPEYTADFQGRQGWKVDYALMSAGQPVIIIECKESGNRLTGTTEVTQLGRYFPFTKARICILTNGIIYRFFTEANNTNTMDSSPFLEVNLEHLDLKAVGELEKFSRGFDVDERLAAASDRKIIEEMKNMLVIQLSQPDDSFLQLFARPLHTGNYNQAAKDKFRPLLQEASREFIRERLNATFQAAQSFATRIEEENATEQAGESTESGKEIETTAQEWQAYDIVKAIVHDLLPGDRVSIRDSQSYCAVLMDNNNRRPLCRFYFNGRQKRLGLFDGSRAETGALNVRQHDISALDDIYSYADQLQETVRRYLEP